MRATESDAILAVYSVDERQGEATGTGPDMV